MGTNYYLHESSRKCATCGHDPSEPLHIGKSSAGWCFSLHVIPESGINSLDDWRKRWTAKGARIVNEYGEELTAADMDARIVNRGPREVGAVPVGYSSWNAFHGANGSEPGPNGMLRHRLGVHCVGHGDGTWDLIPGEFS